MKKMNTLNKYIKRLTFSCTELLFYMHISIIVFNFKIKQISGNTFNPDSDSGSGIWIPISFPPKNFHRRYL